MRPLPPPKKKSSPQYIIGSINDLYIVCNTEKERYFLVLCITAMYFNTLLQETFTCDFQFRDLFIVMPRKLKSSTTSIFTPFILMVRASMHFGGIKKNIILVLLSFINNLFTSIQVLILMSSLVIIYSVDSLE